MAHLVDIRDLNQEPCQVSRAVNAAVLGGAHCQAADGGITNFRAEGDLQVLNHSTAQHSAVEGQGTAT